MGLFVTLVSLLSVISATQAELRTVRHVSNAPRAREAAILPVADFSLAFTSKVPRRKSKKDLLTSLRGKRPGSRGDVVRIDGADFDEEYLTNITVGGQMFSVIVDTGSSDTWVAQQGFNCFDLDGSPLPAEACAFGTTGFNTAKSKTFRPFPNVSFNITYGDGEFLSGPVGFDTVTVGAVSVLHQEIPVPTLTAWNGDGISTGLMGLAFPELTSVYNTTDPTKASGANQIPYSPLFLSAVQQKKVKNPYFSISLDRGTFDQQENDPSDPNLGFLAFGGIAPVPVTKTAVTVPIQGYSAATGLPSNTDAEFFFYTVDVQELTFPGSNRLLTANNNTIVDTGTTLNFMPSDVAATYNARFSPPAVLDEDFGLYLVDCHAKVPAFSVRIGGKSFAIDGRDQIIPAGTDDDGNIICITGTQDGGPNVDGNIFVLGDVFLHNVVTTYNPVDAEITITERVPY